MLYDYLLTHYNPNEPIFIEDITLSIPRTDLLQKLKALCYTGKIKIFSEGIYYIPKESVLKNGITLSPTTVINHKYIMKSGKIIGYYAGHALANQIGITTQVPYVTEIVTNNTATECRKETLCGQEFIVRKARCPITNNNYYILQLLDLLNDLDKYTDRPHNEVYGTIRKYLKAYHITKEEITQYIGTYPSKAAEILLICLSNPQKVTNEECSSFDSSMDPFYSEENMSHLKKLVADVKSGKAKLTEHELIED